MEKTLTLINKQFAGKYMQIEDESGIVIDGIYDHLEWFLPEDIYTNEDSTPMLKCYFRPRFEEDTQTYNVDDNGFITGVANPETIKFIRLDEHGDRII